MICRCYVGNDYKDAHYDTNIANAQTNGISTLAYHFPYPLPTSAQHANRDPISQANLHFAAANGVRACCDLEWPEQANWTSWGIDAAFINQWTEAYLTEYERLDGGRPMIVYTYPFFAKAVGLSSAVGSRPLWIASYTSGAPTIPAPWQSCVLWQNTGGTGLKLNGCPVDTDQCFDATIFGA